MIRKLIYTLIVIIPLFGNTFSLLAQQITFNKVTPPSGTFSGFVGGLAQDKSGYIWIASRNGLCRYDGYNYKKYAPKTPSDFRLETLYIDREGIIWIATWVNDGLYRFDPVTGTFTHFLHDPNDAQSLSHDRVRSFLEDREGTLWIGTHGGLARYNRNTGKFHNYEHNPDDKFSISSNIVRKIYEDSQGTLWIGTGSIWEHEGGETDDGGLNRFDKKTGKFFLFKISSHENADIPSDHITGLLSDKEGRTWIGTENGIFIYAHF